MKKLLVVAIALIASFCSFGQKFVSQHAGPSFLSYQKTFAKVNPAETTLSHQFYFSSPTSPYQTPVAFRSESYDFSSDRTKLVDRTFFIDTVYKMPDYGNEYAIFKLVDTTTKEILYYTYDFDSPYSFSLLTSPIKIKIDSDEVDRNISRMVDDIENEVQISSPILNNVVLHKYIKNGKSTYYLDLNTSGSTLTRGSGVIILFTDGTKWVRPNKISVRYNDGWQYSSWIPLTSADLQTFKTKTIKKYRLYIYDEEVESYTGEEFKVFVSKITQMK